MTKEKSGEPQAEAARFPKEKIRSMERFSGRCDLLGVLLEDGKDYTLKEAETAIRNFMKGA